MKQPGENTGDQKMPTEDQPEEEWLNTSSDEDKADGGGDNQ